MGAVSQSAYTDYDQKIVTGTQVVSAYQNFEGKNVALLVCTQALTNQLGKSGGVVKGSGVDASYGTAKFNLPVVVAYENKNMSTVMQKPDSEQKNQSLTFVNYNALLLDPTGANLKSGTTDPYDGGSKAVEAKMYFDTNCWRAPNGYVANSGKVKFNGVSGNMSKSGMMEYVPTGARFQAYLIKDVSGTTMGVAFEQIGTK